MARAAAPRIPTAWVAWAAAPVNSDTEEDGAPEALAAPLAVGVRVATMEETSAATEEAADSTAEETSERTEEASEATEDATEEAEAAAEETADVTEAAAELASGMTMGTPAAAQVDSTAEMAAARSSALQAPSTQGWTWERSWAPFSQWHAKSVREAQPSLVRGPTKQLSWTMLVYMMIAEAIMTTYSARRDVVELSGGHRGQSDKGSDGEGLHFC